MIASPLIAHRGCSLLAPENSLAAMTLTRDLGIEWIEIDANRIGDGQVIVFHDDRLDRLTPGEGRLGEKRWEDLRDLDVGSHFDARFSAERIPSLDDVLQHLHRLELGLNLEVKTYADFTPAQIVPSVIASLERHWHDFPRLIISSFSTEALRLIRLQKPDWQLGQLWVKLPKNWQTIAQELGLVSIHCDADHLQPEQARAIKAAGYDLYVYTVNDPDVGQRMLSMGVDGLITDDPTRFPDLMPKTR
ncbi:MAG: glycerophosphodiester phosphodiesterase family protein [Saccharospirillum sp.]